MRPRDSDALRKELRAVATSGMVAFAGEVRNDVLYLSEFIGTRTHALRGLEVLPSTGLGGHVVSSRKPALVTDYRNSEHITHHYDSPVAAERLRTILAAPVVVQRKTRAVLYIAYRDNARLDALLERETLNAAHRLSIEIAVRDEADRRLKLLENSELSRCTEADIEVLREIHAELRSLTQRISDPTLRTRLRQISLNLASVWRGQAAVGPAVRLTPRETDVLSHVALGCSNKDTATRTQHTAYLSHRRRLKAICEAP